MKISVTELKGMVPKISAHLIKPQYSQVSTNIKYDSGSIIPMTSGTAVSSLDSTARSTIYKYYYNSTSKWLSWTQDVDIVKDPVFNDTYNRIIVSGLDAPRITDSSLISTDTTVDSSNSYKLGLPLPAAPTLAVTGSGVAPTETRTYTIAYVREWVDTKLDLGPMSSPGTDGSGNLTVDVDMGETVEITDIDDAPTGHGITHIAIYRSATGTTTTEYYLVDMFDIADAKAGHVSGVTWFPTPGTFKYEDDVATVDLAELAENENWVSPDTSMTGIVSLNNGVLAGFIEGYVCFSHPYQCHAWPTAYRVGIDETIVGLGTFGNNIVVCTTSYPIILTVTDPAAIIPYPVKENAPCTSKKAIVSFKDMVVFPSYHGFIAVSTSGIVNLSSSLLTYKEIKNYNIESMFAIALDNTYYGFYIDNNEQRRVILLDLDTTDNGIGDCDLECYAAFLDSVNSTMYVCRKPIVGVYQIFSFNDGTGEFLRYKWKSKKFVSEDGSINLSAARVRTEALGMTSTTGIFDYLNTLLALNKKYLNQHPLNGYLNTTILNDNNITFKLYCDGTLVFTKTLINSKPFRLPAGIVGRVFEFELTGTQNVYEVDLATSMQELIAGGDSNGN